MRRKTLIFAVILLVLSVKTAYPYWIWTPKTGKWINPKNAPKPSPKEQFEYALTLFEAKDYEEARRQFIILLKAYPKSLEASEGQYYLGRIQEEEGNLYEAYLAYQKVIDKYPFSERIQEIIERECKIGEAFLAGAKRKVFGVTLPVDNPAIEIFTKTIENSTYGPEAPKAQYKLGLVLKGLMRYYEAEEAFNKVISNYPGSEWVEAAKYQIATCRAAISRGPAYDQGAAKEAQEKFEEFVREHPDAVLSEKAEENIEELKEKEAEGNFNIARFYEKQKQYESARIYYHEILNKCPDSPWAKKAEERLEVLKRMERKK
ncbi:MAG: outer membrane protein assembly factor BamD [Candidatus Omnitrophota bacterium]|nr:outer membrane protein assembly factor BamD [Candidatus Omnitrophota bacterium]